MSNDLEGVVRPFQSNDVTPAQTYFNAGQIGVPNLHLQFGRGGQGKTMGGSFSAKQTNYMTKYENEKKTATFGTAF